MCVVATKINPVLPMSLGLLVNDGAVNTFTCDPEATTVFGGETQTFGDIPKAEHWVKVFNDSPGLKTLRIVVNGEKEYKVNLKDNETQQVDIKDDMNQKLNTVTLIGEGPVAGSADVVIGDESVQAQADPLTGPGGKGKKDKGKKLTWGHPPK